MKPDRYTRSQLARDLGLSPASITALAKRGMSTDSAEAALAWRREHLDPSWRKVPAAEDGDDDGALTAARATLYAGREARERATIGRIRAEHLPAEAVDAIWSRVLDRLGALLDSIEPECWLLDDERALAGLLVGVDRVRVRLAEVRIARGRP